MKLKNILLIVSDVEQSKTFYRELFGLEVIADFGTNVMLTEGLVLQERESWERYTGQKVRNGGYDAELYFEETNMDHFLEKLNGSCFHVRFFTDCTKDEQGMRVMRIFDPDRHVIEIRERRFNGYSENGL